MKNERERETKPAFFFYSLSVLLFFLVFSGEAQRAQLTVSRSRPWTSMALCCVEKRKKKKTDDETSQPSGAPEKKVAFDE